VPLLRQGTLDFILGRLPEYRYRAGLEVEAFYQEQVAILASSGHPASERSTIRLDQLLDWPWILPPPGTALGETIEAAFHKLNLPMPRAMCESLCVPSNQRLLLESDCLCPFPARMVPTLVAAGMLSRVHLKPALIFGPVGICRRKHEPLTTVAAYFVDLLRKAAAQP